MFYSKRMHEKRQYVRMNTVFPVELELVAENGQKRSSRLLQGFTRDVSEGGMCIELKSFGKETEKLFAESVRVDLTINPTFAVHPILASARIAWLRKNERVQTVYLIGVAYTQIDVAARHRIIRHAKWLYWLPRATMALGLALLALLALFFSRDRELVRENEKLVSQLVESAGKKSSIAAHLYQLQKRKTKLEDELTSARKKIKDLEAGSAELASSVAREEKIGSELDSIRHGKEKLLAAFQNLERRTGEEGSAQMIGWIRSHQNLRTGLVASYEGDATLEDWAFTYDQALAAQAFLVSSMREEAERILDFYDTRAELFDGAFFNAYHAGDGTPVERSAHAGPNLWVGLSALQHAHATKDRRFLPLARRIGDWAIGLQDTEGGIPGGPGVEWYSTEHNLDAYAFFELLAFETGDNRYRSAAERTLQWIKKYAYSQKEKRFNRGKGDATIATDTFSWAIAAIGPERLKEIGFDPEGIMEFAEKNCEVTADTQQTGGKWVKARGFDFAKAEHVGRGGIISTEWTAQVIVTYGVLAKYFRSVSENDKAELYEHKANFYMNELQKLMITSPSRTGQGRGCLPYASTDNADTGHGWRTPKGRTTGSVAGTAYGLFARLGHNPFEFSERR